MKSKRRKRYPRNWEQQARQCKELAGWQCASCKVNHKTERISKRTGVVYTVYLHAAHVNHDPGNPTPALLCLCPTCHGKYDFESRVKEQQISLERLKHQLLLAKSR